MVELLVVKMVYMMADSMDFSKAEVLVEQKVSELAALLVAVKVVKQENMKVVWKDELKECKLVVKMVEQKALLQAVMMVEEMD